MLVVHVITDLQTGGAEMAMKRLIEGTRARARFDCRVISLRSLGRVGAELQASGIRVDVLGMRGFRDIPPATVRLARMLRQLRPDLVHTWMYHGDFLGGVAAKIAGIDHVVWSVRTAEFTAGMGITRSTALLRRMCAFLSRMIPQRIVYVAHSARKSHEKIGYARERGVVIPNGYALPPLSYRTALSSELALPKDACVIGTAGRYSPQKDPKGFVEMAAALANEHAMVHFVMIGPGFDFGNVELARWIKAAHLEDRFHLLGERADLSDLLAGMDIFCLNSIGEGFPNVVAEAMSVGVPCVATDVGDTKYLIGDSGIVVPPRDLDALAGAVVRMVEAGAKSRRSCGERARRRIAEHFSLESVVARYEDLYADCLLGGSNHVGAVERPGSL